MEAFPAMYQIDYDQCDQLNKAIFKVYDALFLELVDKPDDIPEDWLYDVLSTNWDAYVQYLPKSGMDFELCTSDPMTCPYGEYCTCGEDWEENLLCNLNRNDQRDSDNFECGSYEKID